MNYYKFIDQAEFNTFEKQYCFIGFKWTLDNRYDADGCAWDVIDKVKTPTDDITLENYDVNRTPLLYRKLGTLNKIDGYTKGIHSPRESTDGFFYIKKLEDKVIPQKTDENGVIIREELTIPYSQIYLQISGLVEVETEPEWKSEE